MEWWLPPDRFPASSGATTAASASDSPHFANVDILRSIHQFTAERTMAQEQLVTPSGSGTGTATGSSPSASTAQGDGEDDGAGVGVGGTPASEARGGGAPGGAAGSGKSVAGSAGKKPATRTDNVSSDLRDMKGLFSALSMADADESRLSLSAASSVYGGSSVGRRPGRQLSRDWGGSGAGEGSGGAG